MKRHRNYLLAVLLIIYAFNFSDRTAFGLVLQDIKTDLALSDSQLGFLNGVAFALFYSVLGIPIARRADRGNRVSIIALATALWSLTVAICGLARNFTQLMLIRVVVGVGEAGCSPPALSLIADFFSRAERPRAVSIYMQGISLSLVIGYFAAGWLDEVFGWRLMFVMIGLPGLVLAAIAWLTLREPRADRGDTTSSSERQPSMRAVCSALWISPTFRHLIFAYSAMYFFSYGIQQWTPAFFVRSFGMKTGELGSWLACIYGASCGLGTYLGGAWAARWASNNERLQLRVMGILTAVAGTLGGFVYLTAMAPNKYWAFAWLGVASVAGIAVNGPVFAVIQTLVPERMRAVAIALVYLFANLVGMGFGPWVAGLLSDALRPWFGQESLRYALVALSPGYFWVAWHLWAAGGFVTHEMTCACEDGLGHGMGESV
jgi:MFS family permease